jgi:hypothetical protein
LAVLLNKRRLKKEITMENNNLENLSENNSKKNKKADNFIMYIPRKKHLTFEENKGIVKLIFHHDKIIEKIVRWLVKKPCVSDVELDKYGSSVWRLIDGNNSVYDIGQILLQEFGEKIEPVYDRLVMFLRYLNRKGWIAFDRGNQEVEKLI